MMRPPPAKHIDRLEYRFHRLPDLRISRSLGGYQVKYPTLHILTRISMAGPWLTEECSLPLQDLICRRQGPNHPLGAVWRTPLGCGFQPVQGPSAEILAPNCSRQGSPRPRSAKQRRSEERRVGKEGR